MHGINKFSIFARRPFLMAPPTARVADQILHELEALRNSGSPLSHLLTLKSKKGRYGFNDGAIYPKESYPEGTPEKVMRSAALNKDALRGKIKVCVVLVDFKDQRFDASHNKAHFEVRGLQSVLWPAETACMCVCVCVCVCLCVCVCVCV
jgi:hypothetical protein